MSSKREKELARLRAQRLKAKRQAEVERKQRNTVIALGIVGALVVGAALTLILVFVVDGDDDEPLAAPSAAPGETVCTWNRTATAASRPVDLPPTAPRALPAEATMATNRGTITFTLSEDAPCAATSLSSLAEQGFYDDTPCHRLTTTGLAVLQCGDPTGTGTGGPGYQFAEENLDGATYPRGTVAMAKGSAPGTSGSQFFLVYDDSALPPDYTVLGEITTGLDLLDTVAEAGATPPGDGEPNLGVQITALRTTDGPLPTPSGSTAPTAESSPESSAEPSSESTFDPTTEPTSAPTP